MLEILGTVYLISLLLSMALTLWNFVLTFRTLRSKTLMRVNSNLAKVSLYWSMANEDFAFYTSDQDVQADRKMAQRSCLMVGLLGFAGPLGFFLLTIVILSARFLIQNRRAQELFKSEIAHVDGLPNETVDKIISHLRSAA